MARLLLICGSLRRGSLNRKLLQVAEQLWAGDAVWADIDMPLYNGDVEDAEGLPEAAARFVEDIDGADAVLISTPEYNQSFPGGLKNALDWVSRDTAKPWAEKPVAIVSAAAGRAGGARAQYALRLALNPFQPRLLTGPEVMVAGAAKEFDEGGRLANPRYVASLQTVLDKLAGEVARVSR